MHIGSVPYIPLYLFLHELLIRRCLVYKEKDEGEKQKQILRLRSPQRPPLRSDWLGSQSADLMHTQVCLKVQRLTTNSDRNT